MRFGVLSSLGIKDPSDKLAMAFSLSQSIVTILVIGIVGLSMIRACGLDFIKKRSRKKKRKTQDEEQPLIQSAPKYGEDTTNSIQDKIGEKQSIDKDE